MDAILGPGFDAVLLENIFYHARNPPSMILPNKLLTLDYDPAKDVLTVEWPNFEAYALPELRHILDSVVETVRSYDIKHLLIDARSAVIAVEQKEYDEIAGNFAHSLLTTRLKKLARLITHSSIRETHVQNFKQKANFSFEVESFATKEEALLWLEKA